MADIGFNAFLAAVSPDRARQGNATQNKAQVRTGQAATPNLKASGLNQDSVALGGLSSPLHSPGEPQQNLGATQLLIQQAVARDPEGQSLNPATLSFLKNPPERFPALA